MPGEMDGDYYSAVYSWFEKCGIISNVRTHLRQNLVNALKCKDAGLCKDNAAPKSAKQYVYDLLVAEYLWNHNYAYTLSVFASEAPMLVDFCKNLPGVDDESGGKQKLRQDYVQHTLETLGMRQGDPVGAYVVSEYTENEAPLLLCILKSLSLASAEASSSKAQDCQTQTDPEYRGFPDVSEIAEARRKLYKQKEMFAAQLREKESELKERAAAMEHQMAGLDEKLGTAQSLMHSVHLKERQLSEEKKEEDRRIYRREIELATREDLLAREAERLQKERDSYRRFEGDLKKLREELIKVKKDLPGKEGDSSSSCRDAKVQTDSDAFAAEKQAHDREKIELSSLIRVQQSRIEELTLRAVSLSRQLEEAQLQKKTPVDPVVPSVPRASKTNTMLSESSSTEDILQDARLRLRRLEEESLKADQCYFNCITASPL